MKSKVAVLKTTPETVVDDYHRLCELAGYRDGLDFSADCLLKLNLSWTKYFPACSSQPWQVEGVVKARRELADKKKKAILKGLSGQK